jgi:hypothetical protein
MSGSRLHAAAVAAALFGVAATAAAQTPQIRPGLWEFAMSGMGHKQTMCFTPEMVKDVKSIAERGQQGSDCKSSNARTSGNTHTVDIACTKPNKYNAKVTTTITDSDNFTVTQDYAVEAGGQAQKGTLTLSYRRVGECK